MSRASGSRSEHRLAAACAGGLALATAGSWVRFAIERTPRIDTHSWSFLVASAITGAGLILAGGCSLRLARRAAALSWRALWAWAFAVQGCALGALALTSADIFTNLALGSLALSGLSPYAHAPTALANSELVGLVTPRWVHDPSPYGPLFTPIATAAAWVGARIHSPFWGSFYASKAIQFASLMAGLALVARHLRKTRRLDAKETFVLLALGPLLAWEIPGQGHNDGLLFLVIVAFLVAASSGREAVAVAALAAGVAVKYALAPLLVLYLVLVARKSWGRAAVLAVIAVLVAAVTFAPEWQAVTLRSVTPMIGGEAARHSHSFTDLVCLVLDALSLPSASLLAYRVLSAASAVLCVAVLAYAAWRASTLEQLIHGYLLFLFALYLTAPWFQPWYLTWSLPLMIIEPDSRWRRFLGVFSVVTVAQWAIPLDPVTTVVGDVWAAQQIWRMSRTAGRAPQQCAA